MKQGFFLLPIVIMGCVQAAPENGETEDPGSADILNDQALQDEIDEFDGCQNASCYERRTDAAESRRQALATATVTSNRSYDNCTLAIQQATVAAVVGTVATAGCVVVGSVIVAGTAGAGSLVVLPVCVAAAQASAAAIAITAGNAILSCSGLGQHIVKMVRNVLEDSFEIVKDGVWRLMRCNYAKYLIAISSKAASCGTLSEHQCRNISNNFGDSLACLAATAQIAENGVCVAAREYLLLCHADSDPGHVRAIAEVTAGTTMCVAKATLYCG